MGGGGWNSIRGSPDRVAAGEVTLPFEMYSLGGRGAKQRGQKRCSSAYRVRPLSTSDVGSGLTLLCFGDRLRANIIQLHFRLDELFGRSRMRFRVIMWHPDNGVILSSRGGSYVGKIFANYSAGWLVNGFMMACAAVRSTKTHKGHFSKKWVFYINRFVLN